MSSRLGILASRSSSTGVEDVRLAPHRLLRLQRTSMLSFASSNVCADGAWAASDVDHVSDGAFEHDALNLLLAGAPASETGGQGGMEGAASCFRRDLGCRRRSQDVSRFARLPVPLFDPPSSGRWSRNVERATQKCELATGYVRPHHGRRGSEPTAPSRETAPAVADSAEIVARETADPCLQRGRVEVHDQGRFEAEELQADRGTWSRRTFEVAA